MDASQISIVGTAAFAAGVVNGVAGGGSLVSFPALLAVGTPAVTANVTSAVGIWPGYLGGSAGFRREIDGQTDRLRQLLPVAVIGSILGTVLLLTTPSDAFARIAPYLIIFACVLFAVQPLLAGKLDTVSGNGASPHVLRLLVGGASIYGSYFGAGLGVLLLGLLGLAVPDAMNRTNGLRSALALVVNTIAALVFVLAAPVSWSAVGIMVSCSFVGGYTGARVSRRIPVSLLRAIVISLGLIAAIRLLV